MGLHRLSGGILRQVFPVEARCDEAGRTVGGSDGDGPAAGFGGCENLDDPVVRPHAPTARGFTEAVSQGADDPVARSADRAGGLGVRPIGKEGKGAQPGQERFHHARPFGAAAERPGDEARD